MILIFFVFHFLNMITVVYFFLKHFIGDPSQSKPKQVSKHEASSPSALRTSCEMATSMRMSQSVPLPCLGPKRSSGRSKQIDLPGKRKHTAMSMDTDSSNQPEVSSLNDPAFSRSSAKCKNRRPDFVKNILLKSISGDVLQLKETVTLPRHDSTFPEEYLNSSNENEKRNCSSVDLLSSYSAHSPDKNNHISVVDTKENQLQVANSRFFLETSPPFSQDKSTVLPSVHHLAQTKGVKSPLQKAGLSQVLDARKEKDEKRPERHAHNKAYSMQSSNSFSKTKGKTCSVEGSGKIAHLEKSGKSVSCSLSSKEGCMDSGHMSSQPSGELEVESTCTDKSKLNRKSKSIFDSEDESLECNLDVSDDSDEEVFLSLQEILSSSPKPQAATLKESCLDSFCQDTVTPLLKLHVSDYKIKRSVSSALLFRIFNIFSCIRNAVILRVICLQKWLCSLRVLCCTVQCKSEKERACYVLVLGVPGSRFVQPDCISHMPFGGF